MKTFNQISIFTFCAVMGMSSCNNEPKAPIAKIIPTTLESFGHQRTDNYFWLRDRNNPEVTAYLEAENAYTNAQMADVQSLQDKLFEEITSRIKQTDESVPYKHNGYYYYTRYEEKKEYPIYCRKKGTLDADEEIMLDVNLLAEGKRFCQVAGLSVSPDNTMLAYGVDYSGRRLYTLNIINLGDRKSLAAPIENTVGDVAWANDNKTYFFATKDTVTLRSDKIFRQQLGGNQSELVYHEQDETFVSGVYRSKSEQYIIIGCYASVSNEYHIIDANKPHETPKVFQTREKEHEYSIYHYENQFYVLTNWQAKNFRLMKTPENATTRNNWKEIIPHRTDVLLEDLDIFKKYLVLSERKDGLANIRVLDTYTSNEHYIDFGEPVYVAGTSINPEFDTEILRFSYSSLTTPNSVYDYNMTARTRTLLKQQEVVGRFDPADYQAERIYVTARDGARIPVSMVYRKGFKRDGCQPLLLYAYGSYGHTIDPYFNSSRLSLLDRGFVFAIAHIRGGQIYGRQWYEDGKLLKKKNTFNDYIDCAQYLVDSLYTSTDKLFGMGGSAGGLLIGAVANMKPQLFKGLIAAVPFVDVVTTMLDDSIPLTTGEYDEWGNPNDSIYFEYMLSYSPYDNVTAQDYPAMLITTGLHDSQVQYWEPAKWVAKLRATKTDNNLLLLHTNMDAGHGGASGRFEQYKETALNYAFMLKLLNIKE